VEGEGDYMGLRAVEIEFSTGCLADVGSPLKPCGYLIGEFSNCAQRHGLCRQLSCMLGDSIGSR
jgi:hypothetical protein